MGLRLPPQRDYAQLHRCDTAKVSAKDAFHEAKELAAREHGYTGTLAEKYDFIVLDTEDWDDPRVQDKWGPSGCVKTNEGWLFFGTASS